MEDYNNEKVFLSDFLKNNSMEETANIIINKYRLNNYIFYDEEDIVEFLGELDLSKEDIWKEDISIDKKTIVEAELLFDIYKKLYSLVYKDNHTKKL